MRTVISKVAAGDVTDGKFINIQETGLLKHVTLWEKEFTVTRNFPKNPDLMKNLKKEAKIC